MVCLDQKKIDLSKKLKEKAIYEGFALSGIASKI